MTILENRLALLDQLVLARGAHGGFEEGVCAVEAAAWLAGEPHTDHPACVSPVIGAFMRSWNDSLGDDDRNHLLKSLVPLTIAMTVEHVIFTNQTRTELLQAWSKNDGWTMERASRQTPDHTWVPPTRSTLNGSRDALVRHAEQIGLTEEPTRNEGYASLAAAGSGHTPGPARGPSHVPDPGDGYDSPIRWHADHERGNL